MARALIALGANLGDPQQQMQLALEALTHVPGVRVVRRAPFFRTKPVGYADQPDFVNTAAQLETDLSPEALLGAMLGIEAALGRVRSIRNGPRVVDLDLIWFENETRDTAFLQLPHPRAQERAFVLAPLMALLPQEPALQQAWQALSEEDRANILCREEDTYAEL